MSDALNRMMTSLFQRAVDTHQHRLSVRTTIAAVRVAVLANDHRGTNGPFGMIVLERHARWDTFTPPFTLTQYAV